jgi:2-iminobutanoate/2-iminopropanoate deaminase
MAKQLYSKMRKGSDGLWYSSGILPKAENNVLVSKTVPEQTREILEEFKIMLAEKKMTLNNLLKVKVMLASIDYYGEFNGVYGEVMEDVKVMPVRECKGYAGLPLYALVEISFIADPMPPITG